MGVAHIFLNKTSYRRSFSVAAHAPSIFIIFTNDKMIRNCNFKLYNLFILLVWKRQQSRIQKKVGSGLGWSDIEFFRFSKTGTMLPIKFISLVQLRKIGRIWPRMCGKVFTSKSLQIPSIYFKEQSPKKKIRY